MHRAVIELDPLPDPDRAKHLMERGENILGTCADSIDAAEDRERFDEVLEQCGIPRPKGALASRPV